MASQKGLSREVKLENKVCFAGQYSQNSAPGPLNVMLKERDQPSQPLNQDRLSLDLFALPYSLVHVLTVCTLAASIAPILKAHQAYISNLFMIQKDAF